MRLSQYTPGRDNNFKLMRVAAALAVLATHSFPLTGRMEPFYATLGMTMGTWAIDVFFFLSGFLVTSSLLSRQSTVEFVWARFLRIYPALVTMVLLTVFVLGPSFTTLPLQTYFSSPEIYSYLVRCATLIGGVANNSLPGVFLPVPGSGIVNGSLWSLPVEVCMYATWAMLWALLRFATRDRAATFVVIIVASTSTAIFLLLADHFLFHRVGQFTRPVPFFFIGAAFYILRDSIVLSSRVFFPLVAALLLATANKHAFFVVYVLSLGYILVYLAYVPAGFVRRYNGLGDYSYGIFLYAFPVQQSVAMLMPGISAGTMFVIAGAITFVLAFLSWHIVEQRALDLKRYCANRTSAWFARLGKSA